MTIEALKILLFIKKILSIFIVSEDLEFCEQYDAFLRR
jgi:hypothetical protein